MRRSEKPLDQSLFVVDTSELEHKMQSLCNELRLLFYGIIGIGLIIFAVLVFK